MLAQLGDHFFRRVVARGALRPRPPHRLAYRIHNQ
jgi:hypothetical protein